MYSDNLRGNKISRIKMPNGNVQQDSVLSPFETFIKVMEQTNRPTCSLVLPVVGKLIAMLSPERKLNLMDYTRPDKPKKYIMQVISVLYSRPS